MTTNAGFYTDWNLYANPFSAMPLEADRIGSDLLIGRDQQLKSILFRLKSASAAVCLDGPVGVGKTSLANVAAFRAESDYVHNNDPLFLPCKRAFQIKKDESPDKFQFRILTEIAQTLIEKAPIYRTAGRMDGKYGIEQWLNSPTFTSVNAQIAGIGFGKSTQLNEGAGFSESGFSRLITNWLEQIFPANQQGGVICVLDNLELLETSSTARKTIEHLRDTLFNIRGIRWVLCGANGIINSVVSSQRLVGHIGEPIAIPPLALQEAQIVFDSRQECFKDHTKGGEVYLPMHRDSFHKLYLTVNRNLRQTLSYSDEYCLNVAESGSRPRDQSDKIGRFEGWLSNRAQGIKHAVDGQVTPRQLQLLRDSIKKLEGEFSPSDYDKLGFKSISALRPHVKALEEVGLMSATTDDQDQRRKSISVTGKGWLLNWHDTVTS